MSSFRPENLPLTTKQLLLCFHIDAGPMAVESRNAGDKDLLRRPKKEAFNWHCLASSSDPITLFRKGHPVVGMRHRCWASNSRKIRT